MSQMIVWKWASSSLSKGNSKTGRQQKARNVAETTLKVLKPLKNQEEYRKMKLGIVDLCLFHLFA